MSYILLYSPLYIYVQQFNSLFSKLLKKHVKKENVSRETFSFFNTYYFLGILIVTSILSSNSLDLYSAFIPYLSKTCLIVFI
jgi:predicted histidine transporter YuiF (NhaC family)